MRRSFPIIICCGCSDYALHSPYAESNGGQAPRTEDVEAPRQRSQHQTTWTVTQSGGMDVVFFGDTSGSMTEELETLGIEIQAFIDRLDDHVDDWQLMAVTGPDGCAVNGILHPEEADYSAIFADAITTPPGEDWVDEWGLYNVTAAMMQTGQGGCNEGFLRDDAILHVVFISDEDDNSPGWNDGDPDYWLDYVDQIMTIKGRDDQVRFSAITGPAPDGCDGAEPGFGYNEAVTSTGGERLNICGDWFREIDILADAGLLHQTEFFLDAAPIESSIAVEVNQVLIPSGWHYDFNHNSVVFEHSAPRTGDEVKIVYHRLEDRI